MSSERSAQFELLETHVRFEANGDSRREVHARVHINTELGVQDFGHLAFDHNRAFEQVEIPLLRITHTRGGMVDILPSAVADEPNPAVLNAPAYQDVRRKTVRILGLQPGDTLEYRLVTTVSNHPLAPDFWLDHSFDRTGVVSQETFELDLPTSRQVQLRINPATPPTSTEKSGEGDSARTIYHWQRKQADPPSPISSSSAEPDVAFSTLTEWNKLSARFANLLCPAAPSSSAIQDKTAELTASAQRDEGKLRTLYDFVSQKIKTVELPLGSTGFRTRPLDEILTSGYATQEDKAAIFCALARAAHFDPFVYLTFSNEADKIDSLPSRFQHVLLSIALGRHAIWMDPSAEVAPFGMVSSNFRGKAVFRVSTFSPDSGIVVSYLPQVPNELPFDAFQKVEVDSTLSPNGNLSAKVKYQMRGDNELLLRVAFHKQPREKWKDLAQLLSLSDGFRGQVSNVTASDPYATRQPFTVEYEISQPKFVDWKKQPVRIPALLPQLGLPDLPLPCPDGKSAPAIELGTPLDVETRLTLYLPTATTAHPPIGTTVERDYATYLSKYSTATRSLSAHRHLKFVLREIPAPRAADYAAFIHAVQNDEAQEFTLERAQTAPPSAKPKPARTPARP